MCDILRDRPVVTLLNGPPASGKSTLAQRWADVEDVLEVINIDTIRSGLALWPSNPEAAGLAARRMALEMISQQLTTGRSVVVPQFLRRADFIEELAEVANGGAATFIEVALRTNRDEAIEGFLERSRAPSRVEDLDAEVLVATSGRREHLGEMHDALTELCRSRSQTRYVDVIRGDVDATLERLRAAVPEM